MNCCISLLKRNQTRAPKIFSEKMMSAVYFRPSYIFNAQTVVVHKKISYCILKVTYNMTNISKALLNTNISNKTEFIKHIAEE